MDPEKLRVVHPLYTTGSFDIEDDDGNILPGADYDPNTMVYGGSTAASIVVHSLRTSRQTSRGAWRSRRGGRSHNEGSDSELDPYWNQNSNPTPVTNEEEEVNRKGFQRIRDELAKARQAK